MAYLTDEDRALYKENEHTVMIDLIMPREKADYLNMEKDKLAKLTPDQRERVTHLLKSWGYAKLDTPYWSITLLARLGALERAIKNVKTQCP